MAFYAQVKIFFPYVKGVSSSVVEEAELPGEKC